MVQKGFLISFLETRLMLFLFIGTILTMIVQASAATMAITLIMCANGWISYMEVRNQEQAVMQNEVRARYCQQHASHPAGRAGDRNSRRRNCAQSSRR